MKKLAFTSVLVMVVMAMAFAQPTLQWDKRFNGPTSNDKGNAIALDANGNAYITGSSVGVGTGSDFFTIKYNQNGDTLWTRRHSSNGSVADIANIIKLDDAGNVYVTGGSQAAGIITIKYNSDGIKQWAFAFGGGNASNEAYDLEVDVSGNVYVVGRADPYTLLFKINSIGQFQWSKGVPGYPSRKSFIAISNYDGNVIYSGGSSLYYNGGSLYIQALSPANGNLVRQYNTNATNQVYGVLNALVLDGVGNIYVTTTSNANGFSEPHIVTTTKFAYPGTDNEPWSWWFSTYVTGNGQTISGVDMKIDANLNLYVLSDFYSGSNHKYHVKKYRPTDQTIWSATYNATASIDDTPVSLALNDVVNPDIFVTGYTGTTNITTVKFDNNVNKLWDVVYDCGNNGIDIASAMVMDNCDNVVITGYSNCSGTNQDVKTLKYSALSSTITPDGPTTFCQGGFVTLTASQANSYLWSNGATTPSIMASVSGSYAVTITNAPGCSAASSATSVTVNPIFAAGINIGASSTSICAGQNVTFTATPTNGGSAPGYQWFVNNSPVGTGPTYSTTTLPNGAQVYCAMTSNATCASPTTATSNNISITVNPVLTASISVMGPPTICAGDNATFTAMATNGGTAPAYQWYVNNILVGTGPTYSTTTLTNGAQVRCTMNSNAACASPPTATSNTITVTVNPVLTPNLSITGPAVLCSGQNATFTAMPTNGGPVPAYQWFVNSTLVGTGPSYSSPTLANGDQVHCTMTSNAACVSSATATSPTTTVTVLALPNVQITSNGPTTFCEEKSVIFTASPTGSYLWSTGATMKSITVLIAGEYRVTVTATNTCSAVSAPTTVTVNPLPDMPTIFPPGPVILCQGDSATLTASFENSWSWNTGATTQSVNISAPGNYSVVVTNANSCSATSASTSVSLLPVVQSSVSLTIEYSGNDATVTAIPTQGGANPTFQWWLNDVLQTATGPVLQVSNGLPTWVVSCQMTSNDDCALPAQKIDTTLTDIVGASEPILPEKFRISPNPSSGFFTVEFFLPEAKMVVQRVLNVLGQVVWTASPRLEAGEFYRAIDLGPAVTPGIYLLETRLDGRAFLRKIEVR